MICTKRKVLSPIKYCGGQSYSCRRLIALMPEHRVRIDPTVGGGVTMLNLPPAEVEVWSDIDPDLMNFWWVVRRFPEDLVDALRDREYTPEEFAGAVRQLAEFGPPPKSYSPSFIPERVERAAAFFVRSRMSRNGEGESFTLCERPRGKRRGDPVPGDINAWRTALEGLPAVAERMRGVSLWCCPAVEAIRSWDAEDAFFFCDPPFLAETRVSKRMYRHEMAEADHEELLSILGNIRGKAMILGYQSALYARKLQSWNIAEVSMPSAMSSQKTKSRRTMLAWMNY